MKFSKKEKKAFRMGVGVGAKNAKNSTLPKHQQAVAKKKPAPRKGKTDEYFVDDTGNNRYRESNGKVFISNVHYSDYPLSKNQTEEHFWFKEKMPKHLKPISDREYKKFM